MAQRILALGLLVLACSTALAAERKTENVILITFDGVRIQEVFGGMNANVAKHAAEYGYSEIEEVRQRFWRETAVERREALMPFFWKTLVPKGIIYGNKERGSSVKVRNPYLWSSPGYAEILTGAPQADVVDNTLKRYSHRTVLEFVRQELQLEQHKVAQFGSWNGFREIAASGDDLFVMNGAYDPVPAQFSTPEIDYLVGLRRQLLGLWEEGADDVVTFRIAKAYLQQNSPRLMWLAFGESDDWAHADRYDRLLDYLHLVDGLLAELWDTLQSADQYRDRTTLIMTTDHGRGLTGSDWMEHDAAIPGSDDIWVAVAGPDTPDQGEVSSAPDISQGDVAATLLQLFGLRPTEFSKNAGPPIPGTYTGR